MFNKFSTLYLLFAFFLSSCVREEVIPYDKDGKSKLVVIALISPGERINVYVGRSQPLGKIDYNLSDFNDPSAIVTISNTRGIKQNLSLNTNSLSVFSCAQLDFPIIPGETYTINVRSNLADEVTAQTTVPKVGAIWKEANLSGPQEYSYYTFSGSWDIVNASSEVNYGVSLTSSGNNLSELINEGITLINGSYSVKKDVYLAQTNFLNAILLTKDKNFGEFSKKTDLTLAIIENLNSAAFTDVISGFKGVVPNAGNIKGGIGVFGSYLKDVRTIVK